MKLELRTDSVDSTRALGAALAELARPGDLLLLTGDLGAGKTAFTQGFGRGLGIGEPVTSPTFTLAREYEGGRLALQHLDVYRLEHMDEVFDVGLPEMLDEGGVTVIEWGDAILTALPSDYLELSFGFGSGDDDRVVVLHAVGPSWSARERAVTEALAKWSEGSC